MRLEHIDEQGLAHYNRTRCKSDVGLATQRWRNHMKHGIKCQLSALYRLDGVPLCQRHCGDRLIAEALEKQA